MLSAADLLAVLLTAAGCTIGVTLLALLVLRLIRRASIGAQIAVVVVAVVLSITLSTAAIAADKKSALTAFFVQLALNVAWSWVFFGLHNPLAGLGVIVLLLVAILWAIAAFRIVSRAAAWLMLPYLAWVTFATALNAGVYVLNG